MRLACQIAVLMVTGVLAGCAGGAGHSEDETKHNERAISASDLGTAWPLTVDRGVLRCTGRESVTFTAPDGKTYELNPDLDVEDPALRAIWKNDAASPVLGSVKLDISSLIDAGLAICEKNRCGDPRPSGHLVFGSTENGYDLYAVNADGSDLTKFATGPSFEVEWSPDGSRIAFEQDGNLMVARRNRTGETMLAKDVVDFEWSPDGRWVAFGSDAVYIIRSDGSRRQRLRTDKSPDRHAWTDPDRLAWASNRVVVIGSGGAVYASDIFSGSTRQVAPKRVTGLQAWALSQDGRRLAFATGVPKPEIHLINLDGTGFVRLVSNAGYVTELAWSPDRTHLAVEKFNQLAIIALGKAKVTHVGPQTEPRWAPDSHWLGVVADKGRDWPDSSAWRKQVHVIDRNGCGLMRVTDDAPAIPPDEDAEPRPRDLAWDPRAKRVP